MEIWLSDDLEELIKRKIDSGEYHSASEMIAHALHLLDARDRFREGQVDELRREIAVGLEQCERGEVADLDIDEILKEGRRRLAERTRISKSAKTA